MRIQQNNINDDYNFYINFDTLDIMYAPMDELNQFSNIVSRCTKDRRLVLNDNVLNWLFDNFGKEGGIITNKINQRSNWAMAKPSYNVGSVVLYMSEEVALAFKMRWL